MKECTFAPHINHSKIQSDSSNYTTKEVEETLYRMKKGREQHQEKKKYLERGEPSSYTKQEQNYFSGASRYE